MSQVICLGNSVARISRTNQYGTVQLEMYTPPFADQVFEPAQAVRVSISPENVAKLVKALTEESSPPAHSEESV